MGKFRSGLIAGVGVVASIVTLRFLRRRRTTPREEAEDAAEAALDEAGQAAVHAAAALEHARVAGEKAVEYAQEELERRSEEIELEELEAESSGRGRLQRAKKDLIRR